MKTTPEYKSSISADCRFDRQGDLMNAVIPTVLGGPRSAACRREGFAS